MPRRFLVVSTGQNVANLPTILQFGEAGDRVVWIESPEARLRSWSAGARQVLTNRGFQQNPVNDIHVVQINDPCEIHAKIRKSAAQWNRDEELFVVANGGQKLTPIGFWFGLQDRQASVLYGPEQPIVWQKHPIHFGEAPERGTFDASRTLTLAEILLSTGHALDDPPPLQIWPGELPVEIREQNYGRDLEATQSAHLLTWRSHRRKPANAGRSLSFREIEQLRVGDQADWKQSVQKWKEDLASQVGKRVQDIKPAQFTAIYHLSINLQEKAFRAIQEEVAPLQPVAGSDAVDPIAETKRSMPDRGSDGKLLGTAFENAVARRVHAWLQQASHPAIQSAWLRVKVLAPVRSSTTNTSDRQFAELDVVFVLMNGVLVHLECKSAEIVPREIDSQLIRLQIANSMLARVAVCSPCYTHFADREWFEELHHVRTCLRKANRFPVLEFTMPGQPESWVRRLEDGTTVVEPCAPFEVVLERFFEKICGLRSEMATGPR